MDELELPTVMLRIDPRENKVWHNVLSPNGYDEAIGWTECREPVLAGGPRLKGPHRLVAAGVIVELGSADGRFRHEVFVPAGDLEEALLASNVFPLVRPVSWMVVSEIRPHKDGVYYDPDDLPESG